MATILGLDTGSWRTRLARMDGSFRRFVPGEQREVPTLWDGGHPMISPSLVVLAEGDKSWAQADRVASFPIENGNIRLVKLPFADKKMIESTLPSEVESSVPYDLEEMVLVSRLLDAGEGRSRSLAMLARKQAVQARIDELARAHSEPRMLAFDAEVLACWSTQGTQVIVDIGHRRTVIALCQSGQFLAGRVISSGSAAWTESLTGALTGAELSWEEAEQLKHQSVLPSLAEVEEGSGDTEETTVPAPVQLAKIDPRLRLLAEAVATWARDLRTTLIALEDLYETGVDGIVLGGGGSQLGGLSEHIEILLGVPVSAAQVTGGPGFMLAVAVARAGAGEVRATDLRVGELAHHGEAELMWRVATIGAGGVALLTLMGVMWFGLQFRSAWARSAELDDQMRSTVQSVFPDIPGSALQTSSSALAMMQQRTAETARRVEVLGAVAETLKQITQVLPPDVRIDVKEFNAEPDAIMMKAETDSYDTAARIEQLIKSIPAFSQARKAEEKKVGETLQFTIMIPLGAVEAAADGGEG